MQNNNHLWHSQPHSVEYHLMLHTIWSIICWVTHRVIVFLFGPSSHRGQADRDIYAGITINVSILRHLYVRANIYIYLSSIYIYVSRCVQITEYMYSKATLIVYLASSREHFLFKIFESLACYHSECFGRREHLRDFRNMRNICTFLLP